MSGSFAAFFPGSTMISDLPIVGKLLDNGSIQIDVWVGYLVF